MLAGLHLLRPAWLACGLLLPLLAVAWRAADRRRSAWREAVDPHLLPHLLDARVRARGAVLHRWAILGGLALLVLALAGPSWRSVAQPLQGGGGALVVVLDLSSATLAGDLQPSRLAHARARIGALLRAHAGDAGLVAYADDAFTVSPVTTDPANVDVFLDALAPDVMPVDGQRPDRGIEHAARLLAGAGHPRGSILLLAPGADAATARAAARAAAQGYTVSTLAMGTPAGAGYRGRDGAIHRSTLDAASLRRVAAAGGGRAHAWDASPAEVVAAAGHAPGATAAGAAQGVRVAEDGGFWLLPAAMFLLLAGLRRGAILAACASVLLLPLATPALAAGAEAPQGSAWRRADQAAHARSERAEAAYRRGDYAAAIEGFTGLPGADSAYNRGNALARAGRLEDAVAAYDEALRLAPGMPDALANRAAVQAAMERQPPSGGGEGGRSGQSGEDSPGEAGEAGDADGEGRPGEGPPRQDGQPRAPDEAGEDPGQPPEPPPGEGAQRGAQDQALARAQREAMQRALEAAARERGEGDDASGPQQASTAERERAQANEAWLRRVPDDPGALLRARFRNEHLRRRAGER